jgi:hypothetical protein
MAALRLATPGEKTVEVTATACSPNVSRTACATLPWSRTRQQDGTPAVVLPVCAGWSGCEDETGQQECERFVPVVVAEAMPALRQAVTLAASRTPRNVRNAPFIFLL